MDGSDLILAISDDHRVLHAGRADSVHDHVTRPPDPEHNDPGGIPAGLRFYDRAGQRLIATDDLFEPDPAEDAPCDVDRRHLTDRVALVLARWQVHLNENPLVPDSPGDPVITRVPRIDGEFGDIVTCLAALIGDLPAGNDPNTGTAWHGVAHIFGFAH